MDTETLNMLGDSLDSLLAGHEHVGATPDSPSAPTSRQENIWAELAEFGILGLFQSEEAGGFDGDPKVVAKIMEKLGKHLAAEPFLSAAIVSAKLLRSLECDDALVQLAENQMVCALAHWETLELSGQAPVLSNAQERADGWTIDGSKAFVRESTNTTHLIVSASLGNGSELGLFLVPCNSSGISRKEFKLLDGMSATNLKFSKVTVTAEALLGKVAINAPIIQEAWDTGTIAACSEALGVLEQMVGTTADYVSQRKQFGKSLSQFQAVQHRLAEMICEFKLAEAMVFMLLNQPYDALRVSAAKYRVGRALRLVRHVAVQLHGGIGTTDELVLSRYFKRAAVIERSFGSTSAHLARYETLRQPSNHAAGMPVEPA